MVISLRADIFVIVASFGVVLSRRSTDLRVERPVEAVAWTTNRREYA